MAWPAFWRRGETRPAALAVAGALTEGVSDLGIHDPGVWLPADDPHR